MGFWVHVCIKNLELLHNVKGLFLKITVPELYLNSKAKLNIAERIIRKKYVCVCLE